MKKFKLCLGLLLAMVMAGCFEYQITPASNSVTSGNTFTVDIGLNHCIKVPVFNWNWCSDTSDIYGMGFDLDYDPAVIRFSSISLAGGVMTGVTSTTGFRNSATDNGKLVVAVSKSGQVSGQEGQGIIAHVTFTAFAPGNTTISFKDPQLIDSTGKVLVGWPMFAATLDTSSVTVGSPMVAKKVTKKTAGLAVPSKLNLNWKK
jgi:hypothetical protein